MKRNNKFYGVLITLVSAAGLGYGGAASGSPLQGVYFAARAGAAHVDAGSWKRYPYDPNHADRSFTLAIRQPDDQSQLTPDYQVAIGYQFTQVPLRFEYAYSYLAPTVFRWDVLYAQGDSKIASRGQVDYQTHMLNAYYDFRRGADLQPYVGGGVGYYSNNTAYNYFPSIYATSTDLPQNVHDGGTGHTKHSGFAWNLAAGVNYMVTSHVAIGAGVRYLDLGEIQFNEVNPVAGERSISRVKRVDAIAGEAGVTFYL